MKEIKIGYIINGHRKDGSKVSNPVFVEIIETDTGFNLSGRIRSHSFGQIDNTVRDAIKDEEFEYLLPIEEVDRLLNFWDRWHLNDMKSACTHQEEFRRHLNYPYDYEKIKQDLKKAGLDPCIKCNYSYGHGWRTEIPPAKELKFIRDFKAKYEGVKLGRKIRH